MTGAAMVRWMVSGIDAETQCLESLNICFPGWGGRKEFEWCFVRESAERRPDLMTLYAEGRLIAGSANAYRRVRLCNGRTIVAAILSGCWTLPDARRHGAFTRIIRDSRELAVTRGCALVLGFVTDTNASAGRMRDAGSARIPSFYCRSAAIHATTLATCRVQPVSAIDERSLDALHAAHAGEGNRADHRIRFVYTGNEWRDQFIARPHAVLHAQSEDGKSWRALIERTPLFDRVLMLTTAADETAWLDAIDALQNHAAAANRRLFLFTMSRDYATALAARDFEIVHGWMTVLVADEHLLRSSLDLGPSPRLPSDQPLASEALADPALSRCLDDWFIEHGDRM